MADRPKGNRPERLIGVDTNVLIGPLQKELGDLMQVAEEIVDALSDKGAVLSAR